MREYKLDPHKTKGTENISAKFLKYMTLKKSPALKLEYQISLSQDIEPAY